MTAIRELSNSALIARGISDAEVRAEFEKQVMSYEAQLLEQGYLDKDWRNEMLAGRDQEKNNADDILISSLVYLMHEDERAYRNIMREASSA